MKQIIPSLRKLLGLGAATKTTTASSWRPTLTVLEGREVPSATRPDVDLSLADASGVVNGALFTQYSPHPTGSGVMNSFLRVQAKGAGTTVEQGYNTNARPLQFDENNSPQFTRALSLNEVPEIEIHGTMYRQFMLDANQSQRQPYLSLDALRLYVGTSGNLTNYSTATNQLGGLSPVYDLDQGGDHWVKLNTALNPGSGTGDMIVTVRSSLFAGFGPNANVYLYSRFGDNIACNGGLEEWSVSNVAIDVPAPAAISSLSGHVYNQAGGAMAGVVITLTGSDSLGNAVTRTTKTDAFGAYSFSGLSAGIYSLVQTAPLGYYGEHCDVGTVNGLADGSLLSNESIGEILVQDGDQGINYDFWNNALLPS